MTLKIKSTTSKETGDLVASFLNTHPSGVLLTSDNENGPYGAVVYFALDDDFNITFATKTETRKYRNMMQDSRVGFVVYDEKDQAQVQITGRAETVDDPDARLKILNYMYSTAPKLSMPDVPPADRLAAGGYIAFRLIPTEIKLAIYARPDEERDDIYETILFDE